MKANDSLPPHLSQSSYSDLDLSAQPTKDLPHQETARNLSSDQRKTPNLQQMHKPAAPQMEGYCKSQSNNVAISNKQSTNASLTSQINASDDNQGFDECGGFSPMMQQPNQHFNPMMHQQPLPVHRPPQIGDGFDTCGGGASGALGGLAAGLLMMNTQDAANASLHEVKFGDDELEQFDDEFNFSDGEDADHTMTTECHSPPHPSTVMRPLQPVSDGPDGAMSLNDTPMPFGAQSASNLFDIQHPPDFDEISGVGGGFHNSDDVSGLDVIDVMETQPQTGNHIENRNPAISGVRLGAEGQVNPNDADITFGGSKGSGGSKHGSHSSFASNDDDFTSLGGSDYPQPVSAAVSGHMTGYAQNNMSSARVRGLGATQGGYSAVNLDDVQSRLRGPGEGQEEGNNFMFITISPFRFYNDYIIIMIIVLDEFKILTI